MTETNPFETAARQSPTAVAKTESKTESKAVEYVPFGSQDKIKLSVEIVKNLVAVPTRSGKSCSDRDAIKFIAMCQAKRLNPFEGDAFLIGYDGQTGPEFSLITAHQAFLKRAEIHPEYDGMKSGIIILLENGVLQDIEGDFHLQDQNVVGGWATVYYKNRKFPTTRRIRMERFNKGFAQWKVDPAGMICKCAEADALRSSFPTMLGGLYMREEIDVFAGGKITMDLPAPKFDPPQLANGGSEAQDALVTTPRATSRKKDKAEKEPEPSTTALAPTPAPQPESEPEPDVNGSGDQTPYDSAVALMEKDGISEEEVMALLKRKQFTAQTTEELRQVPDNILSDMADKWPAVAAQIRIDRKAKVK